MLTLFRPWTVDRKLLDHAFTNLTEGVQSCLVDSVVQNIQVVTESPRIEFLLEPIPSGIQGDNLRRFYNRCHMRESFFSSIFLLVLFVSIIVDFREPPLCYNLRSLGSTRHSSVLTVYSLSTVQIYENSIYLF